MSGSQAVGVYPLPEAVAQQPPAAPVAPAASPVPPPPPAGAPSRPYFAPPSQTVSTTGASPLAELLHLYFNPSGRINRSTFWLKGILLLAAIWMVIFLLELFLVAQVMFDVVPSILMESFINDPARTISVLAERLSALFFIHVILSLVHAWTNFAVVVKRLHDLDRSAWWILAWVGVYIVGLLTISFVIGIFIILGVLIWILFWLGFIEGTRDKNRYGGATT